MGSNAFDHPLKKSEEEGLESNYKLKRSIDQISGGDESVTIDYASSEEQSEAGPLQEAEKQKTKSGKQSSTLEIFKSKELNFSPSPRKGMNRCITTPVETHRHALFNDDDNITFHRSMTENRASRHELKLDRLSEREKKKLIIELVKIQNDGTVEVDIDENAPVASELLELHSVEGASFYVNESISGCNKSIPRLKVAMLVVGTRGDVQPFLAIAKRLQEFGHRVRLATHANFSDFVRSAGVDFYPLGGDPRVLAGYMARNKGFIPSAPGEISIQRKQLKAIIESLLAACTEPDMETGVPFKAQAIIANPPAYGHAHVAEALGVPIHIFFTMPWTPTYEFPHPLARVPQSAGYWLSYIVVDLLIWWGIRGYINEFRKRKLKLPPIAYLSMYHGSISHLPTGYMWSPHLVPKPSDWGPLVDVVGYSFLNLGSKYEPKEEFMQWIQKGKEPIYIGFGSMPLEDPKNTMDIILEALKDTEQRGIVDRGWGDLGNFMEVPDSVFLLKDCPHDWLFPQCAAVVHHGGAGTTATGLRAGCPTTIVPFFGDQFFWGDRVHQKGLGPVPIPIAKLSTENLSDAIRFMLEPEVKSRAMELAKLIENEDGVAAAVDAFHRHLPPELPLPTSSSEDNDQPNPLQWFFIQIEKWCCLPCS
ncbi:sterol 3-beta-glucosyltransferase UGT80B1-like [Populus nigra]|uniref:sterol 3-beta-glucosyltransferase UGT80B1-like n=1 Tax=Populus nigra TaxID=3691 RepID=UPI002B268FE7|nr:sterol 3-beta-glucosyltransferase UGT80B1-like [Populus nigra]